MPIDSTAKDRADAIPTREDRALAALVASKTRRTASNVTLSSFPGVKEAYAALAAEKAAAK